MFNQTGKEKIYSSGRRISALTDLATTPDKPPIGLVIFVAGAPTETDHTRTPKEKALEGILKPLETNRSGWMLGYYIRRWGVHNKILASQAVGGWGNSTLAMEIAKVLGVPCIQAGKIMRQVAEDYEYHGEEQFPKFLQFIEDHPQVDLELDQKVWDLLIQAEIEHACIVVDTKFWVFTHAIIRRLSRMHKSPTFPPRISYLRVITDIPNAEANRRMHTRQQEKAAQKGVSFDLTPNDIEQQRMRRWNVDHRRQFPLYHFPFTRTAVLRSGDYRVITWDNAAVLAPAIVEVISHEYGGSIRDGLARMAENASGINRKLFT